MKKLLLAVVGLFVMGSMSFAQIQDEQNVTITMDLQPILQLNMETPDQIDFVFDDIRDYAGGITKYGATILKVSSTVNWQLYAVGYSNNGATWDQHVQYGEGVLAAGLNAGTDALPLSALEIYQYMPNESAGLLASTTGLWQDYSTPFTEYSALVALLTGQNSIFYSAAPYTRPGDGEKYIHGHNDALDYVAGGSYLTQGATTTSAFYTVLDYRIVPGMPVVFPFAGDNAGATEALPAGSFAQPGVYTMNVKYVLMENQ